VLWGCFEQPVIGAQIAFSVQLNWLLDAEFAGSYIAVEEGAYSAQGLTVDLQPGGPGASILPKVDAGIVDVGISSPDLVAGANTQGANLRVIGAIYQRSPFCIASLPRRPLRVPSDLRGAKVGVPLKDARLWSTFLRVNGIPDESVTSVPVQFSLDPLLNGEVDGWLAYATNEPLLLEELNLQPIVCLFEDFNYGMLQQVYVSSMETITAKGPQLTKFLRADVIGWREAILDPEYAAKITVEKYGRELGLDVRHQRRLAETQIAYVKALDPDWRGPLWISSQAIQRTMRSLEAAGFHTSQSVLFDVTALEHAYAT